MSQPEYLGNITNARLYDLAVERRKHSLEIKKQLAERKLRSKEQNLQPVKNIFESEQKKYTAIDALEINKRAIENSQFMNDKGELELPTEILKLIDNHHFDNKFKFLAKNWGMNILLIAVEIAKTKRKPSHYLAIMTAKSNRDGTLSWLKKLQERRQKLAQKLEKLGSNLKYLPYFLMAESYLGEKKLGLVFGLALKAEKPAHYFATAVSNELKS